MADSTSNDKDNVFLKSWASTDTINFEEDSAVQCSICKLCIGRASDNEQLEQAISACNPGGILIFKSVVLLHCDSCSNITHLHCFMNSYEINIADTLVHLIKYQLPFQCEDCKDGSSA